MSKEAMKLALEAMENMVKIRDCQREKGYPQSDADKRMQTAITALREALAKPDFWEGYVPEPVKPAQQEFVSPGGGYVPAIPAQQALDKKAENARELGLDYEPVWGGGFTNKDYEDAMRQRRLHQLTSPPAQYSDIVSNGGFDPRTRRRWVSLTDEEIEHMGLGNYTQVVREVEARLKELNT